MRRLPLNMEQCSHVGVAGWGLVDIRLVNDEEDLGDVLAKIPRAPQQLCHAV